MQEKTQQCWKTTKQIMRNKENKWNDIYIPKPSRRNRPKRTGRTQTSAHTQTQKPFHKAVCLSCAALIYTASTNSISLHADRAHSPGSFHCHYGCCCFKLRLNERPEEDKFWGSAGPARHKKSMLFLWENSNEGTAELALQITGRFKAFEALCVLQNPLCKAKGRTNWGRLLK